MRPLGGLSLARTSRAGSQFPASAKVSINIDKA